MKRRKYLWFSMKRKSDVCIFHLSVHFRVLPSEIAVLDFTVRFHWDGLCCVRLLILLPYSLYTETRGICCFLNWGQRVNSPYFYIQAGSALGDWSDVIVLYSAPQLVQLKKIIFKVNILVLQCKAHCSVSWEKKSKAFLIFVNRGPLLYVVSKLLYKSELHRK